MNIFLFTQLIVQGLRCITKTFCNLNDEKETKWAHFKNNILKITFCRLPYVICSRKSQEENRKLRDEISELNDRLSELESNAKKKKIFAKLSTTPKMMSRTILGTLNIIKYRTVGKIHIACGH
jgi:predicted nuclease with TOPRIM domain